MLFPRNSFKTIPAFFRSTLDVFLQETNYSDVIFELLFKSIIFLNFESLFIIFGPRLSYSLQNKLMRQTFTVLKKVALQLLCGLNITNSKLFWISISAKTLAPGLFQKSRLFAKTWNLIIPLLADRFQKPQLLVKKSHPFGLVNPTLMN